MLLGLVGAGGAGGSWKRRQVALLQRETVAPRWAQHDADAPSPRLRPSNAQALRDFKHRIRKYEEVYEPVTNRASHYIKLTDM